MANDFNRFSLPTFESYDWLIPYASASGAIGVSVGDACYDQGGDVAYPAGQMTSLLAELADQIQFAKKFVGFSNQQVLSTETNAKKRFVVLPYGVADVKCPSQTFNKGDLVGIYSNGTTLDAQQVDITTVAAAAIGIVIQNYASATTRVRIVFFARNYYDLATRIANSSQSGLTTQQFSLFVGRNSDGSTIAAAAAAGKFGFTDTAGTALNLVSEAAQNNTKTDTAHFEHILPQNYNTGAALTVTINAQHVEAAGTTLTNTINVACYLVANAGTEGSDLIALSAKAITGSAADYAFALPGAGLAPGSKLHFVVTSVATEGGNTGTTKNQINSIRLG